MSGFDDNPFADPAVHQATTSAAVAPNGNLDDYNPFDKQKTQTQNQNTQPDAVTAGGDANAAKQPPPYTQSAAQQQVTAADFQKRQDELEARARELERREQALRNAPYDARAHNWPPVPAIFPVKPCFYQDINVDIPVEFQKIVRYLYYLWCAHASLLLANMLVGLLYLFAKGDMGQTFLVALIYLVIFTPGSYLCWFRPVYKAFRDDSSFQFMVYFFIFFFQFLMSCVQFLGVGNTGSCGLILALSELSGGTGGEKFVGALMLITSLGFGCAALADFLMLVRVHRIYRSTGASMAKAQAEFTSGVMKNETVRQAAAEAAREGVRNTFAPGANNQQPAAGTGSRY